MPTNKPKKAAAKRGYHHGDLKVALLAAAERILREEGVPGLKLRAITRVVGVSHTAADPHFGSLTGLLSELAGSGFERLSDAMEEGARPGVAYVRFAIDNPALFQLMFRNELLDVSWPRLRAGLDRAGDALGRASGGEASAADVDLTFSQATRMAHNWGIVHGLAMLAISGWLGGLVNRTSPPAELEAIVSAALLE